jgi:hypothetical protein
MYFDLEARTDRVVQANMFLEKVFGKNCGYKMQICKDPLNLLIFV